MAMPSTINDDALGRILLDRHRVIAQRMRARTALYRALVAERNEDAALLAAIDRLLSRLEPKPPAPAPAPTPGGTDG